MGLCCSSDITTINMPQSCVKLYECTKFGTNIVGEMCTNSVTWFCAYLCKTEDTMNYTCCNIWCTTWCLLLPLSANTCKSAWVFIFCFYEIFPSFVHILKTRFNVSSTLFYTPFVLFSCTPSGTKSYLPSPSLFFLLDVAIPTLCWYQKLKFTHFIFSRCLTTPPVGRGGLVNLLMLTLTVMCICVNGLWVNSDKEWWCQKLDVITLYLCSSYRERPLLALVQFVLH